MPNTGEIATIILEVEAFVAQVKAAAADGRLSAKEVLGLIGAVGKLATHVIGLL